MHSYKFLSNTISILKKTDFVSMQSNFTVSPFPFNLVTVLLWLVKYWVLFYSVMSGLRVNILCSDIFCLPFPKLSFGIPSLPSCQCFWLSPISNQMRTKYNSKRMKRFWNSCTSKVLICRVQYDLFPHSSSLKEKLCFFQG